MTPDTIEHEGKTLKRLPSINGAHEGDWAMISGELYPIGYDDGYNRQLFAWIDTTSRIALQGAKPFIQAAYREKRQRFTSGQMEMKLLNS